MPAENGLPQYVSKNARSGLYQYYRRPPSGVAGSAFVRSFGSKDRKTVSQKYAAIHSEAEAYFFALISGRAMTDQDLFGMALTEENLTPLFRLYSGKLNSPADWQRFITQHGTDQMKSLTAPDRDRLIIMLNALYAGAETAHLEIARVEYENKREYVEEKFGQPPAPQGSFTLEDAYKQAWLPAKHRPHNSIVEISRYVAEFTALNGARALRDYTRDHWAKWRADCLEKHGAGWTAFKRFTMMKTICTEAIRAGLLKRSDFHGQDITLRKPARKKLRNEGWMEDELKELWSAPFFRTKDKQHPDANYWVPLICATTGARLSEVTGMLATDAAKRHGLDTLYLAKEAGKTEDSRRIIPVPQVLIDLGWLRYVASRPKDGPLFDAGAKVMSQWFSRVRADLGLNRKGCDLHAMRHHIRTLLSDLECPDRVADYITGHAPPNVGGTYGKTELSTALRFLNKVELGINVPKWKGGR